MSRTTAVRATPARQEAAPPPAHGRVRLRKNAAARSLLDLPADIVATIRDQYGTDLQWVTSEVLGKDEPAMRQAFEINGWQPVTPDMFGGIFDGMYTKKGHKGEINYQGLVLMERPMELTIEANQEDRKARDGAIIAQQNMIKGGVIPGMSAGFEPDHPTALPKNVFSRVVKAPMDIPKE